MGAELNPVAGSRIYIGGQMTTKASDFVLADFASQTWVEIDGWSQMGGIGDSAEDIATKLINRGRTVHQKGTADAGSMQNVFAIVPGDPGQTALRAAAAGSNKNNYGFKIIFDDDAATRTAVTTVTIAAPGVFTSVAHGLEVGDAITLSTTGALPTGLASATTYYVKTAPSADTFTLAATLGGAAIATTGSQSGVHSLTTMPTGSQVYFVGLAMSARQAGGSADTIRNLEANITINSNIVEVAAAE